MYQGGEQEVAVRDDLALELLDLRRQRGFLSTVVPLSFAAFPQAEGDLSSASFKPFIHKHGDSGK